jgi:hypothetical protein
VIHIFLEIRESDQQEWVQVWRVGVEGFQDLDRELGQRYKAK